MAVGQHKAIAIGPMRMAWIVAVVTSPQRERDLCHAHRHARVTGLGGFDGVHRECANGVGEALIGGGGSRRGVRRHDGFGDAEAGRCSAKELEIMAKSAKSCNNSKFRAASTQ
jgi:hypothetical protein